MADSLSPEDAALLASSISPYKLLVPHQPRRRVVSSSKGSDIFGTFMEHPSHRWLSRLLYMYSTSLAVLLFLLLGWRCLFKWDGCLYGESWSTLFVYSHEKYPVATEVLYLLGISICIGLPTLDVKMMVALHRFVKHHLYFLSRVFENDTRKYRICPACLTGHHILCIFVQR